MQLTIDRSSNFSTPIPSSLNRVLSRTVNKTYTSSNENTYLGYSTLEEVINNRRKLYRNMLRLVEIASLEYNWNYNEADTFDKKLIQKAASILHGIVRQPKVFPTANDSIQFEYEKADGDYLEFELFIDKIKVFRMLPDETEQTEYIIYDINHINRKVCEFYESNRLVGGNAI